MTKRKPSIADIRKVVAAMRPGDVIRSGPIKAICFAIPPESVLPLGMALCAPCPVCQSKRRRRR